MSVRYIKATMGIGESATPFNIITSDDQMITFDVKVIDLPGPTRNAILYPLHEMKIAVERPNFVQQLATGSVYGEHDHPSNPEDLRRWGSIDMDKTSFKWQKFWFEGSSMYGTVQTVPINGNKLLQCIKAGELPNFSIRVLGQLAPNQPDLYTELCDIHLITVDWVRFPGNPDSFVKDSSSFNVMESPLVTGKYGYESRLRAAGESYLTTNGMLKKGEGLINLDNGLFAVAESISAEKYDDLKKLRANSFL